MRKNGFGKSLRPLCKFGPGGDYVTNWPEGSSDAGEIFDNPLTSVLTALGSVINTRMGAKAFNQIVTGPEPVKPVFLDNKTEKPESESKISHKHHPKTTGNAKGGKKLRKEPMLFGDDCRAGRTPKRKQKHRVRAHRSASPKRANKESPRQGTLFEINRKSGTAA